MKTITKPKYQEITFINFIKKYKVYKRRRGDLGGTYLLAPSGEDRMWVLDHVKHPFKQFTVWTILIENGQKIIKAGYHIDRSRVGHILSKKKWKNKTNQIYVLK